MKSFPLLLVLALLPIAGRAETTLGPAITAVPVTISKAGVYHFTRDLTFGPSSGNAINITVSDVVIDMNGHELLGTAGDVTSAIGINCNDFGRVVIKNGTIRGFENGVVITSNGGTVCDLLVSENYSSGITVVGNNTQILRNRVCNTGGAASAGVLYSIGITLTGTYGVISGNDVQNTNIPDATNRYADGIRLKNCTGVVVSNNRVDDVEPATPAKGTSTGIATIGSSTLILLSNTVLTTENGFDLSGSTSGKYGDNITSQAGTPYVTGTGGMTDIGNNN